MDTTSAEAMVSHVHTHLTALLSEGILALEDAHVSVPEGVALGWQAVELLKDFLAAVRTLDGSQRRALLLRLRHSRLVFDDEVPPV